MGAMDNQIQGGVIASAVFAPRHPERTSLEEALHAVPHAAWRDADSAIEDIDGSAGLMKQIIGNALLPKVRKAH